LSGGAEVTSVSIALDGVLTGPIGPIIVRYFRKAGDLWIMHVPMLIGRVSHYFAIEDRPIAWLDR
jgi:hypothetical protein